MHAPMKKESLDTSPSTFSRDRLLKLIFHFFGLQISYLIWGILQERIMTGNYNDEQFTNSQYLVFVNRFLAMIISFIALNMCYSTSRPNSGRAPFMCYGIISYANCMSTWFQYESLLYISFPVQVIAKSIKTIPVMLVGRFVSGKTYPVKHYLLMLLMASGIALFLAGYQEGEVTSLTVKKTARSLSKITTFNGVILLICYLVSIEYVCDCLLSMMFSFRDEK
jgi:solute carrier family 35 (adenosine 3'-phospho 5'-phosphosulfate transporter), member B2